MYRVPSASRPWILLHRGKAEELLKGTFHDSCIRSDCYGGERELHDASSGGEAAAEERARDQFLTRLVIASSNSNVHLVLVDPSYYDQQNVLATIFRGSHGF
jgi:hypothetical protein